MIYHIDFWASLATRVAGSPSINPPTAGSTSAVLELKICLIIPQHSKTRGDKKQLTESIGSYLLYTSRNNIDQYADRTGNDWVTIDVMKWKPNLRMKTTDIIFSNADDHAQKWTFQIWLWISPNVTSQLSKTKKLEYFCEGWFFFEKKLDKIATTLDPTTMYVERKPAICDCHRKTGLRPGNIY